MADTDRFISNSTYLFISNSTYLIKDRDRNRGTFMVEKKGGNMGCYTIGHSNRTPEQFLELLKKHDIEIVVDVRSVPYSKYVPHFNKGPIEYLLKEHDILYRYMGDTLGGSYSDPALLYPDGRVDYAQVKKTTSFKDGIKELIHILENKQCVTLMCTERDPFDCHRFVLLSHTLAEEGIEVTHIVSEEETIPNDALEKRLIDKYKSEITQTTLFESFDSRKDILEEAYVARNKEIAKVYHG